MHVVDQHTIALRDIAVEKEVNLLVELYGTVPVAAVRRVVLSVRRDLDGQVTPGAFPELLHRCAQERLQRVSSS